MFQRWDKLVSTATVDKSYQIKTSLASGASPLVFAQRLLLRGRLENSRHHRGRGALSCTAAHERWCGNSRRRGLIRRPSCEWVGGMGRSVHDHTHTTSANFMCFESVVEGEGMRVAAGRRLRLGRIGRRIHPWRFQQPGCPWRLKATRGRTRE